MKAHTYHSFDDQLNFLADQVKEMSAAILAQFDNVVQAIYDQDTDLAVRAIQLDSAIDRFESTVDAGVLTILARDNPLANDLRTVLGLSKMVGDLERSGDELVKMAWLVMDMYTVKSVKPKKKMLNEIRHIADMTRSLLEQARQCIPASQADEAYQLINREADFHEELEKSVSRQFEIVQSKAKLFAATMNVLQILNCLQRCGDHCINIAAQKIFMLEGRDVRHQ